MRNSNANGQWGLAQMNDGAQRIAECLALKKAGDTWETDTGRQTDWQVLSQLAAGQVPP